MKFGQDISAARRRRRLTVGMMTERLGVSRGTYLKIEKGDPTVGIASYAMALFVLGFDNPLESIADVRKDDQGLLLDEERLPERVRRVRRPRTEATPQ